MAESEFFQYLAHSLRTMLTIRAEELVRVSFSKDTYAPSKTELRPQSEIDAIMSGMQTPIERLVERYIVELKAGGLTSPKLLKTNDEKLVEITARMERELEAQLRSRLGRDDN